MPRRRNDAANLGVMLLIAELVNFGVNRIPPVTLSLIIAQTLLFLGYISVPWSISEICLSAESIIKNRDWKRFLFSSLEHGDDMHLYYNMASFLIKGITLEKKYGSHNFGVLLIFLTFLTNFLYVIIGKIGADVFLDEKIKYSCAVGFSGVIFALKVLTTHEQPQSSAVVGGIRMPGKYAAWAELVLIHLLVPNASFIGHLAGILAGIIYTKTYAGTIIDNVLHQITGVPVVHNSQTNEHFTYPDQNASSNYYYNNNNWRNYGWRNNLFTSNMR